MQVKKIIISVSLCFAGITEGYAQNLIPDVLPYRPTPHAVVRHLPNIKPSEVPAVIEEDPYEQFSDNLMSTAMKHLGARYSRGAMGPNRFDCSGFTSYVYKLNNVQLKRSSRSQYTQGIPVSREELHKGDLVFFSGSRRSSNIGHVGIVTDVDGTNFSFIHAAETGVIISRSSEYYYRVRYVGARRIEII